MDRSNSTGVRVETLEDALARHCKPELFNTGQGSQFTGATFTGVLASHGIPISMDARGAWRDNVFVEHVWRSVKYEEVHLRAYDTVSDARASMADTSTFPTPLQNTQLAILLKRRGFVGRDAIPRGILGCGELAR